MKRIGLVITIIVLVLGGLVSWRGKGTKQLRVRVVDSAGAPVAGAVLTPDGIRGTDRAHYWWRDDRAVKPTPVRTDADGCASFPYPPYVHERIRSIEISFGVNHPDFSPERPFIPVASGLTTATPPLQRVLSFLRDANLSGKVHTVTLHRAATIEVTAMIQERKLGAENFHVQVVSEAKSDLPLEMASRTGEVITLHQIPAGKFCLRAVGFFDGKTYFSALTDGIGASNETNRFLLDMKPAAGVRGRLEGVPTPIKNGWINVRVVNVQPKASEPLIWADYAPIGENGEFEFLALPSGRLETVALCDGYVSQNPPGKPANTFVYPSRMDIPTVEDVVIPMIPTGAVEIKVVDPAGRPVSEAEVGTWPNIQWADYYSTVFASDFYRTSETLQSTNKVARTSKRTFNVKTDQNGIAHIMELPGTKQDFGLDHKRWELPVNQSHNRSELLTITPQVTNRYVLKVQEKGKEFREE